MLSQLTPPPELKDGISGAQVNGNETATVGCSLQRHQGCVSTSVKPNLLLQGLLN